MSETCAVSGCGNIITLTEGAEARLRKTHATFYCPLGHNNYFPGKTDATRVKELEVALQDARSRATSASEWRDSVISARDRSIRTLKGHITRLKKRGRRHGDAR